MLALGAVPVILLCILIVAIAWGILKFIAMSFWLAAKMLIGFLIIVFVIITLIIL